LATLHQRRRQTTGQTDRQRSDSIGRTVLQTVAPKQLTDRDVCITRECRYPMERGTFWCIWSIENRGVYPHLPMAQLSHGQFIYLFIYLFINPHQDLS